VVGASSAYGLGALATGTTVKLSRAVWIAPCVLAYGWIRKSEGKAVFPLFILGFIAVKLLLHALHETTDLDVPEISTAFSLVVIIGGRVIPLFTGNRLGLKIAPLPILFDYLAIGSTVVPQVTWRYSS